MNKSVIMPHIVQSEGSWQVYVTQGWTWSISSDVLSWKYPDSPWFCTFCHNTPIHPDSVLFTVLSSSFSSTFCHFLLLLFISQAIFHYETANLMICIRFSLKHIELSCCFVINHYDRETFNSCLICESYSYGSYWTFFWFECTNAQEDY